MTPFERSAVAIVYDLYFNFLQEGKTLNTGRVTVKTTDETESPYHYHSFNILEASVSSIQLESYNFRMRFQAKIDSKAGQYNLYVEDETTAINLKDLGQTYSSGSTTKQYQRITLNYEGSKYTHRVKVEDGDERGKAFTFDLDIQGVK